MRGSFRSHPRDKLFMSVNYIYVDWDLLQLSVSHAHTVCVCPVFCKKLLCKACLQMPSYTCFPTDPVGLGSWESAAFGAVFLAVWFTKHLHQKCLVILLKAQCCQLHCRCIASEFLGMEPGNRKFLIMVLGDTNTWETVLLWSHIWVFECSAGGFMLPVAVQCPVDRD